jgi:hypothetical protein
VRVWAPAGYRPASAGVVVYVHGYFTQPDEAWKKHNLVEQFRKTGLNALFIVPAAPTQNGEEVKFPRLNELLRETAKRTQLPIPGRSITAIAHSGGYRTVLPWLSNPELNHVVLLDGLYAGEEKFLAWARGGPHRLTIVGQDTAARIEPIFKADKTINFLRAIPPGFAARDKTAHVLYMHSQYNHTEMVLNGKVIPLVVRRSPIALIGARR